MKDHDALRELIPPVALGAATEQEQRDLERHAATCHDCRAELDGLRAAAAGLALQVPQMDPPAALKVRIMDAVHAEGVSRAPVMPARRRWAGRWPALAGAFAVLAAGLLTWNVVLQDDGAADRRIAFAGAVDATVSGQVVINEDGVAVMRVAGLPPLRPDQGYELWTIRGGVPRSEGFAAHTATGEVVVATADLHGVTALAITPERRTNTASPTVAPVVMVPLTASA